MVEMAVLHTNAYKKAKELSETLRKIFSGEIVIRDAGPAIACHAGEGAVAIAFQKKFTVSLKFLSARKSRQSIFWKVLYNR